jgi:hypothetical protein
MEANLVPPEPAAPGFPALEVAIEGGPVIWCQLNGKSLRRALKQVAELGPDTVNVMLQGNLKPGGEGGMLVLDSAGITVMPRTPPAPKEASS